MTEQASGRMLVIGVLFIVFGIVWGVMHVDGKERAARRAWMTEHQCRPESYVRGSGAAVAVYRCNDGAVYTLRDMPTR